MSTDAATRISDTDRAAVATRLSAALGEGRLTVAEFDDRLRGAYRATTDQDLVPLTADLPAPQPAATPSHHWRDWIGSNLFFVAIWAWSSIAAGQLLFFWPLFIMLLTGAGMRCLRRKQDR